MVNNKSNSIVLQIYFTYHSTIYKCPKSGTLWVKTGINIKPLYIFTYIYTQRPKPLGRSLSQFDRWQEGTLKAILINWLCPLYQAHWYTRLSTFWINGRVPLEVGVRKMISYLLELIFLQYNMLIKSWLFDLIMASFLLQAWSTFSQDFILSHVFNSSILFHFMLFVRPISGYNLISGFRIRSLHYFFKPSSF